MPNLLERTKQVYFFYKIEENHYIAYLKKIYIPTKKKISRFTLLAKLKMFLIIFEKN